MDIALVVEDHPLFRNALADLVQSVLGEKPVTSSSAEDGLEKLRNYPSISMIVMDMGLPGMSGAAAVSLFRKSWPEKPVLVVSGNDDAGSERIALEAGASAYLSKMATTREIADALRQIAGLGTWPGSRLTKRQKEILSLLCQGHSNKSIGNLLHLADPTVKMHISSLFRLFDATSRTQVIIAARNRYPDLLEAGAD